MRERGTIRRFWNDPAGLLSRLLVSRQFLPFVVILYALLGIAWVSASDALLAKLAVLWPEGYWWYQKADLWLVVVASGLLAGTLWAHTRAEQVKDQALLESLNLQQVSSAIDAELLADKTLAEVLAAVCAGAVHLGHQFCWAGLVKPDGGVEVVASHGFAREYLDHFPIRWDETPYGMGPVGHAIRSGRTCVFQDALRHPDYGPWREAARRMGFKAVAAVPVVGHKGVLGVLAVYNRRRHSFDQKALFNLELLAQKASLAILTSGRREALETLNQQHQLILDSVKEGIFGTDLEGRLTFMNKAAAAMLGYGPGEVLGMPVHDLIHRGKEDGEEEPGEPCPVCRALTQGKGTMPKEDRFCRKDGSSFPVELEVTLMQSGGENLGAVVVFRDLTEEKRIQEQVSNLANYDLTTGVYNRRRFKGELKRVLAQARHFRTPGALLLVEIDGFKGISSSLGQLATEQLLVQFTALLKGYVRDTDVLGNLGGDEFGIILYGLAPPQVQDWAHRVLQEIRKHEFAVTDQGLNITASMGITYFDGHAGEAEQVLLEGEHALFLAKIQGANRAVVYEPGRLAPEAPWSWRYRLRRALEKEQFILQFQPVVDLRTNRVVGYEALVRLVEDDGRLVLPGVFLPWAERYGLVKEIDCWAVGRVVEYLKKVPPGLRRNKVVGINISGYTLTDGEFRRFLPEVLKDKDINPNQLVFEITETAAVSNLNEVRDFVDWVKRLGARFALDDFGAGFSTLNYLKYLPVDYLKIDGNFIRDLSRNPVDQQLVRFMVEIANTLHKKTVAEYVEDGATAELLQQYGVDYGQGYFFGKPGQWRLN